MVVDKNWLRNRPFFGCVYQQPFIRFAPTISRAHLLSLDTTCSSREQCQRASGGFRNFGEHHASNVAYPTDIENDSFPSSRYPRPLCTHCPQVGSSSEPGVSQIASRLLRTRQIPFSLGTFTLTFIIDMNHPALSLLSPTAFFLSRSLHTSSFRFGSHLSPRCCVLLLTEIAVNLKRKHVFVRAMELSEVRCHSKILFPRLPDWWTLVSLTEGRCSENPFKTRTGHGQIYPHRVCP
jgi:hypothetical protein